MNTIMFTTFVAQNAGGESIKGGEEDMYSYGKKELYSIK